MESKYLDKLSKKGQKVFSGFLEIRKRVYGENYFTDYYLIEDFRQDFNGIIKVREKFKIESPDDNLEA